VAVTVVTAVAGAAAAWALQQDFSAYWVAGRSVRLGLDPYINYVDGGPAPALWDGVAAFRHSRFLYPPLIAELFRLPALLPFRAAKAIFTGLSVVAWLGAAALVASITGVRRDLARMVIAGALFFPLYLHLEQGQIDLLLLVLLLGAWRLRERPVAAGALLAGAAMVKPALLVLLPILAALGRPRWVAATLGWGAGLLALTAIVSGPALRRYVTDVAPRAARYGEGGTEGELLRERDRQVGDEERVAIDGRSYLKWPLDQAPWEITASASLPRLLAPRGPTDFGTVAPVVAALVGLCWAAGRWRRRAAAAPSADDGSRALIIYVAAAVACVVISPAGWAMGLCWGLPLVPLALRLRAEGQLSRRAGWALAAAWIACAIPAPVTGWPALAGTALVVAACAVTLTGTAVREPAT
jgi:hypothetical protein